MRPSNPSLLLKAVPKCMKPLGAGTRAPVKANTPSRYNSMALAELRHATWLQPEDGTLTAVTTQPVAGL